MFYFRSSPKVVWLTKTSHGIVSASHAHTVQHLWLDRDLHPVTTNHIALNASESSLLRGAHLAPSPSLVIWKHCSILKYNYNVVKFYIQHFDKTRIICHFLGIGGTRFISFEDRHWHNDCFICASCKTSLVGRGFITDAQDIICPECAKQKLL